MPGRFLCRIAAIALIGAAHTLFIAPVLGQANRPIAVLSPFAAGASTDFAIRVIAQKVTDTGGTKVVVDNRPGGAGTLAASAVKAAAPDGSTLLLASVGTFASNVSLIANLT